MPDRYKGYECYPLLASGYLDPPIVSGDTNHSPSDGFIDKKTTKLWNQDYKVGPEAQGAQNGRGCLKSSSSANPDRSATTTGI